MPAPIGYSRKKSPRGKGVLVGSPRALAASEALKKKWQDPEFRAKHTAINRANASKVRLRNRSGVPDGMRAAQAQPLWDLARQKAKYLMSELEKEGVVQFDPNIPEDEMAKAALAEAFTLAMSPMGDTKLRHAAMRTVLEWTRAKPATKTDLRLNSAEAWLKEVIDDHRSSPSDTD
jgi:hypothetical protein